MANRKGVYSDVQPILTQNWVCQQVRGSKVLDVGCGQGDISLLLGREGFDVVGLDVCREAVDDANLRLRNEEESVRRNVTFIHQNIYTATFESGTFDTVIVGKMIEQVVQPQRLLAKIWEFLKDGGLLVMTTPFGINEDGHPNQSSYLSDWLKVTAPYFEIKEVEFIGKKICFTGTKRASARDELDRHVTLMEQEEAAFYHVERTLLDVVKEKEDRLKWLDARIENLEKTVQLEKQEKDALAHRIEAELAASLAAEQKAAELKQEIETVKLQLDQITKEREALTKEKEQLAHELKNIKSAISGYEKRAKKVVSSKDKNIRYLRNRLAVTEQSVKFRLGSALINSVKNPLTIPKNAYLISRMLAGGVRRKLKGIQRKYKLPPLPYDNTPLPAFSQSGYNGSSGFGDERVEAGEGLNELLLTGLHEPTSLDKLKVAAILDDFSTSCFAPECTLITFRPDNWREVFSAEYPHLLFVESAWKGNSGAWQYKIAKYSYAQGPELDDMLSWCRRRNIPTVFWNKEDPVHFDRFIHTARKFDIIFTSDANCIEKYKEVVEHDRVYSLPFAAQPVLHNPTRVKGYKQKEVCFAGSYYANRHPQRRQDMERLLDGALNKGLEIYDRNYGTESEHFRFPERFQPYIKGSLPYDKLVNAYKHYKVFLNCNSVTDSPTMFSRRVFELLACGTTVVSTHSKGIEEMFGNCVLLVDGDSAGERLDEALTHGEWRRKNELMGMREIFNRHTYRHRLHEIARKCGYDLEAPYAYRVALFAVPSTGDEAERIAEMFVRQSYRQCHLYLFVNRKFDVVPHHDRVSIVKGDPDQYDFVEDYVGVMSPSHYYGRHYVEDLVHAVKYSKADIVGKASVFAYDREKATLERCNEDMEYIYTQELVPEAALFSTEWIKKKDFRLSELRDKRFLREAAALGARLYAADAYNFILHASRTDDVVLDKLADQVSV